MITRTNLPRLLQLQSPEVCASSFRSAAARCQCAAPWQTGDSPGYDVRYPTRAASWSRCRFVESPCASTLVYLALFLPAVLIRMGAARLVICVLCEYTLEPLRLTAAQLIDIYVGTRGSRSAFWQGCCFKCPTNLNSNVKPCSSTRPIMRSEPPERSNSTPCT